MIRHTASLFASALSVELLGQTLTSLCSLRVIVALICIGCLLGCCRRRKRHHRSWWDDDDQL
ncbi:hypothetical protein [Cardiobacterium valvarum]|uniref:hypothetical protein n=1 Tax=Cardiobacterium valvarum TaxID=194702 RepID=UPI0011C84F67|nr:hypothetical protein [Cardiobacterium valvarum]